VKNISDHPGVFVTSALKKDLYGEGPQA